MEWARLNDPTVCRALEAGMSLEEIIGLLLQEKHKLFGRVLELERIAPRAIIARDGKRVIWRCPDHLVPITDDLRKEVVK